jgi:hypothetical protein
MVTQLSRSHGALDSTAFPKHKEITFALKVGPERVFAYLDDFRKLSAHMEKSSMMMMGSRMTIETDGHEGIAVGSVVQMRGKILGIALRLREVVTERDPPYRKAWQTLESNLLVIGQYELGFQLTRNLANTQVRVFIDYSLPDKGFAKWLGLLFAESYARWCIRRMAQDAAKFFSGRSCETPRNGA